MRRWRSTTGSPTFAEAASAGSRCTDDARRGLLGQASFLLVTSVANRTSPVGARQVGFGKSSGRLRHRCRRLTFRRSTVRAPRRNPLRCARRWSSIAHNPVCAACHKIMDPIGFSLENFDLIGRYRASDGGIPIDASGQLVDGTKLNGAASLRMALLSRSDVFVRTMTEKLMIYGTGRALQYYDMPVVRSIARDAAKNDNRFSSLIVGIVKSDPFQMRVKQQEIKP